MNAADLPVVELAAALRRGAAGDTGRVAAVELLCAHEHWLRREVFLAAVQVWNPHSAVPGLTEPMLAAVDWDQLITHLNTGDGLYDTGSERAVLAIACSFAVWSYAVALGDALGSLDRTNVRLVAAAVLTAGGAR